MKLILEQMHEAGATPLDLTEQQLALTRQELLGDLFAFAYYIFDYQDLDGALHGQICKLVGRWGTPGYQRLLIQIPRGHFKTSLCTIANSLWQVCKDPNAPVAIFNEKEDNTAKWIRAIKDVVQSSGIFQRVFKDLLPPGVAKGDKRTMPRWWKWSDTELMFQRSQAGIPEASITGLGIGSASAGGHWPKIIKDDLISEDAKNSPAVMDRAKDWFDNSFALEKPALGGQDLIVCTPWSYNDLYSYAVRKYDYKLYRRSAIEDDQAIFPSKFSLEGLQKMQKRDPFLFSSQLMCQPRPGKEQSFEYEWLRFGSIYRDTFTIEPQSFSEDINPANVPEPPTPTIHLSTMEKTLLVDPAPTEESEKKRDRYARTAIVVVGVDFWGRRYILDVWAERASPPDVIDRTFQLMEQWGTHRVAIEEVVFSVLYRYWIQERARNRNQHVACLSLKPGKRTKDARIETKITPFRLGHYYLNRSIEQMFVQEYLEYPYSGTRDILDALAYDDEPGVCPRPLSPEEALLFKEMQEDWRSRYHGISEVTNY